MTGVSTDSPTLTERECSVMSMRRSQVEGEPSRFHGLRVRSRHNALEGDWGDAWVGLMVRPENLAAKKPYRRDSLQVQLKRLVPTTLMDSLRLYSR